MPSSVITMEMSSGGVTSYTRLSTLNPCISFHAACTSWLSVSRNLIKSRGSPTYKENLQDFVKTGICTCHMASQLCNFKMKKHSEEMQTLHAGCSKAEPKNFAPLQTPFLGAWDGQNLISWRWSWPLPTNPVWWGSMHAISSYHGNRPAHTSTHRQDRLQYTTPQLVHSVIRRLPTLIQFDLRDHATKFNTVTGGQGVILGVQPCPHDFRGRAKRPQHLWNPTHDHTDNTQQRILHDQTR